MRLLRNSSRRTTSEADVRPLRSAEIKMEKEITLLQYIKAEHERLDAFRDMWARMADNDDYPDKMQPGDWEEQLIAFHYKPNQPREKQNAAPRSEGTQEQAPPPVAGPAPSRPAEAAAPKAKFRKKPVVIEAIQYKPHENCAEVAAFLGQAYHKLACDSAPLSADWILMTLEGEMICRQGDWIIKGVKGEFYPCKDEIFRETYEPAAAAPQDGK